MPPRTSRDPAGATTRRGTRQPEAAAPAGAAAGNQPREDLVLQSLSKAVDARTFTVREAGDEDPVTRSFQLVVGVVERAKAVADGIQHRAYDTPLEGQVPASLSALVTEALNVACTYYENLLNDGQEFKRVRRLKRGPTPEGAQAGAEKRVLKAAAKRDAAR